MSMEKGENNYDVVIVGAGISGINFAYRLQERNPELSFTILENRHEIGGTWSLFKYPGIRSDSDLYTFGFPWRPWTENTAIAKGDLIRNYMRESAEMHGIDKKIRFHHKVEGADYSSEQRTWSLSVTKERGERTTFRCRFLLMCTGYYDYNEPLATVVPGLDDFDGPVIHPQFWPEELDYTDKDVVIIGSGATSVTLLPAMTDKASHVTMLQRSPGYVLSTPSESGLERLVRASVSGALAHRLIRVKWMWQQFLVVSMCTWFPRFMRDVIRKAIAKGLPESIPLDPNFNPSYFPFEQRLCLCPDADFFKALRSGKGDVVTGRIEKVTARAIRLEDGRELHPDIIVKATGLKLVFAGGVRVTVDGRASDLGSKFMWKGVMLEDLPNCAFTVGYVDASWTLGADATAQLICRMLGQMRREGVLEVVPRRSAAEKREMGERKMLRLTSTYIDRAKGSVPKCGDRGQWLPRSYYFKDILTAWFGDIKSGTEWVRGV